MNYTDIQIITNILLSIFVVYAINTKILNPLKRYIDSNTQIKKIKYADRLLLDIRKTIEEEVANKVKYAEMSGEPYKMINFDDDLNTISSAVKQSYKDYIIINNDIYSTTYVYKYIARYTAITLFQYANNRDAS